MGPKVCMVDIDLGSSTLGSVWGVREMRAGVKGRVGVHELLRMDNPEPKLDKALENLWDRSAWLRNRVMESSPNRGRLALLPGNFRYGDSGTQADELKVPLYSVLSALCDRFEFVFADIRSGLAAVTQALFDKATFQDLIGGWLIFHRWTPQHLIGASDMVELLKESKWNSGLIHLVRTAYVDPNDLPEENRRWFVQQNADLAKDESDMCRVTRVRRIGVIPFSRVLQWQERIISRSFLNETGLKTLPEADALRQLAQDLGALG